MIGYHSMIDLLPTEEGTVRQVAPESKPSPVLTLSEAQRVFKGEADLPALRLSSSKEAQTFYQFMVDELTRGVVVPEATQAMQPGQESYRDRLIKNLTETGSPEKLVYAVCRISQNGKVDSEMSMAKIRLNAFDLEQKLYTQAHLLFQRDNKPSGELEQEIERIRRTAKLFGVVFDSTFDQKDR